MIAKNIIIYTIVSNYFRDLIFYLKLSLLNFW